MKKFNLIIGKRQIMISTLLLILAIAAYLNWLAAGDQSVKVMDVVESKKTESTTTNDDNSKNDDETESNYGEAVLVSAQPTTDYFNQAKMQKTATHDNTYEELNQIINSPGISPEKKNEAESKVLQLTEIKKQEETIENLIKIEGFEDCVTYIENNKVSTIVKAKNMSEAQAGKIKEIILRVTPQIKPYDIVVTPID